NPPHRVGIVGPELVVNIQRHGARDGPLAVLRSPHVVDGELLALLHPLPQFGCTDIGLVLVHSSLFPLPPRCARGRLSSPLLLASSSATRTASLMDDESATPLPAMSNAVP